MIFAPEDQLDSTPRKKAKRSHNRPPFYGIKKGAYDDFVIIRHGYQPPCLHPETPTKTTPDIMINARTTTRYDNGDHTFRYKEAPKEIDKSSHAADNHFENQKLTPEQMTQYALMRSRMKILKMWKNREKF